MAFVHFNKMEMCIYNSNMLGMHNMNSYADKKHTVDSL